MASKVKAAFLLLGGLFLCGLGIWFIFTHADLVRNGSRAPGMVVAFSVQRVRGSKLYHPIVRYRPAGQGPVEFKERTGLWASLFEIGDPVTVLYFPSATDEARIESFWTLWFLPLIMELFGAERPLEWAFCPSVPWDAPGIIRQSPSRTAGGVPQQAADCPGLTPHSPQRPRISDMPT